MSLEARNKELVAPTASSSLSIKEFVLQHLLHTMPQDLKQVLNHDDTLQHATIDKVEVAQHRANVVRHLRSALLSAAQEAHLQGHQMTVLSNAATALVDYFCYSTTGSAAIMKETVHEILTKGKYVSEEQKTDIELAQGLLHRAFYE